MNQRLQVGVCRDWRTLIWDCWAKSILCDKTNQNCCCLLIFESAAKKSGLNSTKIAVLSLPRCLSYHQIAVHIPAWMMELENLIKTMTHNFSSVTCSLRKECAPDEKHHNKQFLANYFPHKCSLRVRKGGLFNTGFTLYRGSLGMNTKHHMFGH